MKNIFIRIGLLIIQMALRVRYKIRYVGIEEVKKALHGHAKSILFLPNHPAVFNDPLIITVPLLKHFSVRPLIVEYMYYSPLFHWAMRAIHALPMPNFTTGFNQIKQRRAEKVIRKMSEGLKQGDSFLIYPAGMTKQGPKEIIGGAFATHQLIQENPHAHVVLVRTTGLWGSTFSRAFTQGDPVHMMDSLKTACWTVLKNLIFFVPKREVLVEFELAPKHFPYQAPKLEFNHYLEDWYNKPFQSKLGGENHGEPLKLVSYSFYKEDYPQIKQREEEKLESGSLISEELKDQVRQKIGELSKKKKEDIQSNLLLQADLGLDSLDLAELIAFLDDRFDIRGISPGDLTTVSRVFLIAAKIYKKPDLQEVDWNLKKWFKDQTGEKLHIPEGKTIPEVFLRKADAHKRRIACGDPRAGLSTYFSLKKRVLLLAEYIQKLPGEYVGILLPACTATQVIVLACQLVGKIPVMINWTVGGRHLDTVVQVTKLQAVLTSWAFIDNLENVDISRIEDILVVLEEMKAQFSVFDLCKAYLKAHRSADSILRQDMCKKLVQKGENGVAVVLFTSGTETNPKGVPLSHKNLLSNQRGALSVVNITAKDKLLAMLPPFHSFGFAITGIFPLISGMKVVFFPNPTDSKRLAKAIRKWKATLVCSAPTFLKNILLASNRDSLASVRLMVSGAEKAQDELFRLQGELCPQAEIMEGYGITECSPVLSINATGDREKGVGQALPGVHLQIVHPETLEALPENTVGLVLAAGPNIFSGYLNGEVKNPFVEFDGKTWYQTGDLGKLDAEGNLILAGRLKRFIKIGGEMVSLTAVEDTFAKILSQNVKNPKELEMPQAAICSYEEGGRPKLILFTPQQLEHMQANRILRENGFSNLVKVDRIVKVGSIPVGGTGKIAYRELEKMLTV